jgi:hypothetical protein
VGQEICAFVWIFKTPNIMDGMRPVCLRRESGIKLKQTRAEIDALDELLAQADTLRKKLKAEAAEKRASQQNTSPEVHALCPRPTLECIYCFI